MSLYDALTDRDEDVSLRPGRQRNRLVTTEADRKARRYQEMLNDPANRGLLREKFVSPWVTCLRFEAIVECAGKAWEAYAIAPDADQAHDLIEGAWRRVRGTVEAPVIEMDAGTPMAGKHQPRGSCETFGS